eukprot:scaffold142239_cov30-Tisochrysis_lutea.AAC.1
MIDLVGRGVRVQNQAETDGRVVPEPELDVDVDVREMSITRSLMNPSSPRGANTQILYVQSGDAPLPSCSSEEVTPQTSAAHPPRQQSGALTENRHQFSRNVWLSRDR